MPNVGPRVHVARTSPFASVTPVAGLNDWPPPDAGVNVTLMPAALAIIVVTGYRLLREFAFPSLEIALAVAGFVAVLLLGLNPTVVLVAGGLVGAFGIRRRATRAAS